MIADMLFSYLTLDDGPQHLADGEVHLWSAPLDRNCDERLLTVAEHERASRFKMDRVRRQFVSSRAQLRLILARYLPSEPIAIPILTEISGKPFIDRSCADGLEFNVSHSETLAVYAVTRCGRVGVDVECWRDIPNAESLVERFFTRRENDLFLTLPTAERLGAFFRAWTRKEAVLKAVGYGVQSLDQCDVTFFPDEPATVLRLGEDTKAADKWLLKSWQPTPEYVAAVAVERRGNSPRG